MKNKEREIFSLSKDQREIKAYLGVHFLQLLGFLKDVFILCLKINTKLAYMKFNYEIVNYKVVIIYTIIF